MRSLAGSERAAFNDCILNRLHFTAAVNPESNSLTCERKGGLTVSAAERLTLPSIRVSFMINS